MKTNRMLTWFPSSLAFTCLALATSLCPSRALAQGSPQAPQRARLEGHTQQTPTDLHAKRSPLGTLERGTSPVLPNSILFVTQVPQPADFATIGSTFSNHRATMQSAPRGGDLWMRYPDGSLCNLTETAGFGNPGFQGANAIAVRDPAVHWTATKAVFSMVIGAPTERYQWNTYYWQLYEVSGWDNCENIQITLVANQPQNVNNVSPIYASDDRILFVSDRSRSGEAHLRPQLDEYESTASPSGLWSLNPATGDLFLMNHAPSGSFDPSVDSFGRVIFTRWDHLQRDQQSDADPDGSGGTFDYSSEAINAARSSNRLEVFPEPRSGYVPPGQPWTGHTLNNFFPWQINQDGTAEEFVNHVGRHELQSYFNRSRFDDPELEEFIDAVSGRTNPNSIANFLQIREDPTVSGRYVGTDAPEFDTHASGQIIAMTAPPNANPDGLVIDYITHRDTETVVDPPAMPPASHTGHYRDPLPLSDGTLIASHTATVGGVGNIGTNANPIPTHAFRLRLLEPGSGASAGYQVAATSLTTGISKSVQWWDPDEFINYSQDLWELNPVEVKTRTVPPAPGSTLQAPELAQFALSGTSLPAFVEWMRDRNLGLISVRDATVRDDADRQQPFNIRAPGGHLTTSGSGTIYDISHMQLFQGDQVRGYGGVTNPNAGRRVLARVLHDPEALAANNNSTGPAGSVVVASDGSVAAFVPARRALAWQTVAPSTGEPIVRERFWITLQPGEIRACDGCHGVNVDNQAGGPASQQEPLALLQLLNRWNTLFQDGFENGDTSAWD